MRRRATAKRFCRRTKTDRSDAMLIFSHSGINAVTLDIAVGAKDIGMKVIGVTSIPHSSQVSSRHSCGKRLFEVADVVIDTGAPLGDAGVEVAGLEHRVGATSTSVAIAVGQAINAATAELLVKRRLQAEYYGQSEYNRERSGKSPE